MKQLMKQSNKVHVHYSPVIMLYLGSIGMDQENRVLKRQFYIPTIGKLPFGSHDITVLYPRPCYNEYRDKDKLGPSGPWPLNFGLSPLILGENAYIPNAKYSVLAVRAYESKYLSRDMTKPTK